MDNLASIPVTENCLNAGIAFGTTTTTNVATAATGAVIGGKFTATLSSSATTATPTTDAVTGATFVTIPVNYCAALVFGVNAAGSLVAAQGPLMPTLAGLTTTAGGFIQAPQFPALPSRVGCTGALHEAGDGIGRPVARHEADAARLRQRFLRAGTHHPVPDRQHGDHGRAPARSPSTTAA